MKVSCSLYLNCPICGKTLEVDEEPGWKTVARVQGICKVFSCYNPFALNPLHYYSHIVDKDAPEDILYQEFSLDLGTRSVIFGSIFQNDKSLIKSVKDMAPLELDFIIVPDFPNLESLKRKVRTALTFA